MWRAEEQGDRKAQMPRAGHRTVGSFSVSVCVRILGRPGCAEEVQPRTCWYFGQPCTSDCHRGTDSALETPQKLQDLGVGTVLS